MRITISSGVNDSLRIGHVSFWGSSIELYVPSVVLFASCSVDGNISIGLKKVDRSPLFKGGGVSNCSCRIVCARDSLRTAIGAGAAIGAGTDMRIGIDADIGVIGAGTDIGVGMGIYMGKGNGIGKCMGNCAGCVGNSNALMDE